MVIITSSKASRLLFMTFIQRVIPEEIRRSHADLKALVADLPQGYRALVDYTSMESMDIACAPEVGRSMETIDQGGVSMVVRVIPDPSKDIGMNILSRFHYRSQPQLITCCTLAEACQKLEL